MVFRKPLEGSQVKEDTQIGASYSYTAANRELITYDTVQIAKMKAKWVVDQKVSTLYLRIFGESASLT